jgi:ATP-binding cassette, subfamily B, bacterial PglK
MKLRNQQLKFIYFIIKNFKLQSFSILILSLIQALLEVFSIFILIACLLSFLDPNQLTINNLLFKKFIDLNNFSDFELKDLLLLLTIIYLSKNIFLILINWFKLELCGQIYEKFSIKTFGVILKKEITFFDDFSSGDFMQSVVSESEYAKEVLVSYISVFTEIIIILFIFFILFFQDTFISLNIILSIILGSTIYALVLKKINNKLGLRRQNNSIGIYNTIIQSLSLIKLIKLKNKNHYFTKKLKTKILNSYKINRDQSTIHYSAHIWLESFVIITLYFLSLFLINKIDFKTIDLLEIFFVIIITLRFIPSFSQILGSLTNIQYGEAAIEKVMHFLKEGDREPYNNYTLDISGIELSNVFFKYKNSNNFVLENFNLSIKKPSLIGIKGRNGSGKTTLLNIISGLLKPTNGSVILNGQSIYDDDELLFNWRQIIGYVDQKKNFSNQNIFETIAFGLGKNNYDKKKINECLEKVDLLNHFKNLPDKMDSYIGESAIKLSGGQMQRLNIARSLYDEPKVFIFDEITNNLDQDSKIKIMNLINELKKEKIIFISSHSEFVLKNCDHIIEL